jgi:molybdopterin/thiamine biosynthesis adenylyltransferase/proteasome lid subunit RPN8/RPN11
MNYSLTFCEADFARLTAHLFAERNERAAYLLCRLSQMENETRLLVREVLPVTAENVTAASPTHMGIESRSFLRAMKRAHVTNQCFVFVHSHPTHLPNPSEQDDREEAKLFHTAYARIDTAGVHGSVVLSGPEKPVGRVWLPDGQRRPISVVRVIGSRFRFLGELHRPLPEFAFFDRQVRAFGKDLQILLKRLTIGVVGAGGTGSAVIEQLIRLGVGHLIVADGQRLEESNVSRVYGSSVSDSGRPKVEIQEAHATRIGLGTEISILPKDITFPSAFKQLRACDLIFGCTDDQWGRSLLSRLAIYYYIPVFDMGVRIDSADCVLFSVQGRVTTLMPGTACLFCRGRIIPEGVRAESLQALNPDQATQLREEGYAPELANSAPAIVPFTTAVAAGAVSELLHRLAGYMGPDRNSTEVLYLFDQTRLRTNRTAPRPDCFCTDRTYWGRGDTVPLLDTTWRPE